VTVAQVTQQHQADQTFFFNIGGRIITCSHGYQGEGSHWRGRGDFASTPDSIDGELKSINTRIDAVHTRIEGVDTRIGAVHTRIDEMDKRRAIQFESIRNEMEGLSEKVDLVKDMEKLKVEVAELKRRR
jgi:hypothetical protein